MGWSLCRSLRVKTQFSCSVQEYFELFIAQTRGSPAINDATCSGQQIIAGQLRSNELAELVSVLPTDRPGDIYGR